MKKNSEGWQVGSQAIGLLQSHHAILKGSQMLLLPHILFRCFHFPGACSSHHYHFCPFTTLVVLHHMEICLALSLHVTRMVWLKLK